MTKSRDLITKKRKWTDEDKRMVTLLYPCTKTETLAKLFNCTLHQMYNIAFNLQVSKSQLFKDSPMSQKLRSDNSPGEPYRFKKGNVPPNKGKKITPHPNSVHTQFKPGSRSPNYKPVGTIRVVEDGYLEIKMAEGMRQWKSLHRVVWERCNGKIPNGLIVSFIDGNKQNVEITNLRLMTKAENAIRNNPASKYGIEIKQIYQLKGAITRQINKRIKQNERHSSTQSAPV